MKATEPNGLLGFHYYNDTDHFSKNDLDLWLPVLKSLEANWLYIQAPSNRAIPEFFVTALVNENISPVLHFTEPIQQLDAHGDLDLLLATYAKWGVKHVVISNEPNMKHSWSPDAWIKEDLVDQFTYPFINVANQAINHGMKVFLPPLVPGGDYWDTLFLWETLKLIEQESPDTLKRVGLTASADIFTYELSWGVGGPDRWPAVKPYHPSNDEQDQRGFHIYDWYDAISKAVIGHSLEMFVINAGKIFTPESYYSDPDKAFSNLGHVFEMFSRNHVNMNRALPPYVLGGFIYSLTSADGDDASWFNEVGLPNQFAAKIIENHIDFLNRHIEDCQSHPIDHYLLLPTYEWGVADWHLDVVKPFVKKFQPTIGFSVEEATLARKVTVLGGQQVFAEEILDQLRNSGSEVHRIEGDGTELVSKISKQITN